MYIDPNTGGMLFQILAALFALISGTILFFSGRIRMFFARMRRRFREGSSPMTEDSEVPDSEETVDA